MVSDSVTRMSLNDTTPEQLFKAMAMVQNELSKATVKGGKPKAAHAVSHISDMADYYVRTTDDIYKTTKTGNASFKGWKDYQLYQTKDGWAALGVPRGRLSTRMVYDHASGNEYPVPQFMNGVEFDYEGDEFQEIVDNFLDAMAVSTPRQPSILRWQVCYTR
jgi:hypothetical protein